MAASNNCILHHFKGHEMESHGISGFYNWGENSDKIFNVRTSPLTPRQRCNAELATGHQ